MIQMERYYAGQSRLCLKGFARGEAGGSNVTNKKSMPLINVKVIEGVFTDTQKREMIRKLTDSMVSIEGEQMRQVTWVVIEEVKRGDWGIGGKPVSTQELKPLANRRLKRPPAAMTGAKRR